MADLWTYDEATRAITDENGLTVARDVGVADAHAILAGQAGDAGAAYNRGFDDGFSDGANDERAAAEVVIRAAQALIAGQRGSAYADSLALAVHAWEARS